jgi:hypothetical protein
MPAIHQDQGRVKRAFPRKVRKEEGAGAGFKGISWEVRSLNEAYSNSTKPQFQNRKDDCTAAADLRKLTQLIKIDWLKAKIKETKR